MNEEIRKQLHEILDIVLDGNGLDRRKQEMTGNLPTLFFWFSGHIAEVQVDIHNDGWASGEYPDKQFHFLTNELNSPDKIEALRAAVKESLEGKEYGNAEDVRL